MKEQVEKILSKPTITYEAGDGSWQQESSLTLRQIEEVASEICQLYEPLIQQAKEEGIRKVVEWVDYNIIIEDDEDRKHWREFIKSQNLQVQSLKSKHLKG